MDESYRFYSNLSQCKKNNLDEVYFERLETSFYEKSIKDHNVFFCYKLQELKNSLGVVNFTGYYTSACRYEKRNFRWFARLFTI